MKYNFSIVSVFSVGLFLALSGCQAQEPAVEPESTQAEQSTKVSINVVGEEPMTEDVVTETGDTGEL